MYYIGLDVHKKTISHCVKDASGQVHREGTVRATRNELDCRVRTLPQPRIIAMEVTIFTGWIYDHLLPHADQVKVAHPLVLRAIAAAKKKNDRIDAGKIADCLRCDFLPECHMASTGIRDRRRSLRYRPLLWLSRETIDRCRKTGFALVSSLEPVPLLAERIQRLRTVPGVGPIAHLGSGDRGRIALPVDQASHLLLWLCGEEKSSADKVLRTR
jgi:transposase